MRFRAGSHSLPPQTKRKLLASTSGAALRVRLSSHIMCNIQLPTRQRCACVIHTFAPSQAVQALGRERRRLRHSRRRRRRQRHRHSSVSRHTAQHTSRPNVRNEQSKQIASSEFNAPFGRSSLTVGSNIALNTPCESSVCHLCRSRRRFSSLSAVRQRAMREKQSLCIWQIIYLHALHTSHVAVCNVQRMCESVLA